MGIIVNIDKFSWTPHWFKVVLSKENRIYLKHEIACMFGWLWWEGILFIKRSN
jgi:hypothetical protein